MLHKPILARRTGNRLANRLRLGVPAGLELTHATIKCLIDDVSATGVRLRAENPPKVGETAILHFHLLRLCGAIVWRRADRFALRFDSRLPVEDMEGFLWIVQHPEDYARLCRESGAHDWSVGRGA